MVQFGCESFRSSAQGTGVLWFRIDSGRLRIFELRSKNSLNMNEDAFLRSSIVTSTRRGKAAFRNKPLVEAFHWWVPGTEFIKAAQNGGPKRPRKKESYKPWCLECSSGQGP